MSGESMYEVPEGRLAQLRTDAALASWVRASAADLVAGLEDGAELHRALAAGSRDTWALAQACRLERIAADIKRGVYT